MFDDLGRRRILGSDRSQPYVCTSISQKSVVKPFDLLGRFRFDCLCAENFGHARVDMGANTKQNGRSEQFILDIFTNSVDDFPWLGKILPT